MEMLCCTQPLQIKLFWLHVNYSITCPVYGIGSRNGDPGMGIQEWGSRNGDPGIKWGGCLYSEIK